MEVKKSRKNIGRHGRTDGQINRRTVETGVQTVRVNHKMVNSQRRKEKRRFNYFVYSLLWRRKGTEGMND